MSHKRLQRRRTSVRRRHDHLLHPLRDRPPQRAGVRAIRAQLGEAIPRCGADLVGYFAPHEGSSTTAYGVYNVESLAAYEAYRARLRDDPVGRENYDFAQRERFIVREDRIFLRLASAPHGRLAKP